MDLIFFFQRGNYTKKMGEIILLENKRIIKFEPALEF